jgi:dTDP-4-amino-4,6-dideoxygalactose transaminase
VEGVNSRLDGIQSAILSVKLKHLDAWTAKRQTCAALYDRALDGANVVTPPPPAGATAVYHLYVVRVAADKRSALQQHLSNHGIQTYPIALPNLDAYKHLGYGEDAFPNATAVSQQILSLPMFPELTERQILYIADHIRGFMGTKDLD